MTKNAKHQFTEYLPQPVAIYHFQPGGGQLRTGPRCTNLATTSIRSRAGQAHTEISCRLGIFIELKNKYEAYKAQKQQLPKSEEALAANSWVGKKRLKWYCPTLMERISHYLLTKGNMCWSISSKLVRPLPYGKPECGGSFQQV